MQPRGRGAPSEPPSRPGGAPDRNGAQRGRIETSPELPRAAAPDWSAPAPRGAFEAPPVAPAGQDAGKANYQGSGGGWLSGLLTRASREGEDPGHNGDRGALKPPAASKERAPPADDRNLRLGIDSVDSLSVDIARMIDDEVAADLWERRNRGERNVSWRRLYTPQGRKAFEEMRKRYKSDREFRDAADRYINEFDRLLGEVGHGNGGPVVARNYITSEAGRVYTMLAHAAGRLE